MELNIKSLKQQKITLAKETETTPKILFLTSDGYMPDDIYDKCSIQSILLDVFWERLSFGD